MEFNNEAGRELSIYNGSSLFLLKEKAYNIFHNYDDLETFYWTYFK